jgi:hypothetical protein
MKTAVEWFAKELYDKFEMKGDGKVFDELLEQAKEMEKEQQMKTYKVALMRGMSYDEDVYHENKWRDPEKYYNETFKQQEQ